MVGLEPGRLVGRQRERRGVRLAEAEGRERLEHLPDLVDGRDVVAAGVGARAQPHLDLGLPVGSAERAADLVGLGQGAAGERRDDLQHLLVEDDDAAGLLERRAQVGVQVLRLGPALPGLEERRDHVALDRAGPEQRDVDDRGRRRSPARTCRPARAAPATRSGSSRGCGSTGSARRCRGSSSGTWVWSSRSIGTPPSSPSRAISSTACAIADCIRMPSTSSLSRPSSSTSSLSNWLIGKPSQLASTGVRSSSVASDSSTPHGCSATCRGSPSSRSTSRNSRSSWPPAEPRRPAARAARAARRARRGPGCAGTPWRSVDLARRQPERGADVADRVPHPVGVHHRDAGAPARRRSVRGSARRPRCAGRTRRRCRCRAAPRAAARGTAPSAGRAGSGRRRRCRAGS